MGKTLTDLALTMHGLVPTPTHHDLEVALPPTPALPILMPHKGYSSILDPRRVGY